MEREVKESKERQLQRTMRSELRAQAERFGANNRMLQTIEEMGELIQAICKYQRIETGDRTCNKQQFDVSYNIAEEIADVEICLEQLKYLMYNSHLVDIIKAQKIKRTKERLNEAQNKQNQKGVKDDWLLNRFQRRM